MTADEVKSLLSESFADAEISVLGEGAKFEVSIVSDAFEGKRPVPRQQLVYGALNAHIQSGEIHAVTMNLKTKTEAA
ncbi:MAG: BolA/IbaG family iron-sulfur metabolism protein [Reinekea sp.]|jgi:acid stress-induced BolA-like protein IbaG/YrbA